MAHRDCTPSSPQHSNVVHGTSHPQRHCCRPVAYAMPVPSSTSPPSLPSSPPHPPSPPPPLTQVYSACGSSCQAVRLNPAGPGSIHNGTNNGTKSITRLLGSLNRDRNLCACKCVCLASYSKLLPSCCIQLSSILHVWFVQGVMVCSQSSGSSGISSVGRCRRRWQAPPGWQPKICSCI